MTTFGESCIIGMLLGEFKGILLCIFAVEAYTASWIEMCPNSYIVLKILVEAYTASWIEMYSTCPAFASIQVEAYTASWIEIAL